jgi:hypothetical protein
MEQAIEVTDYNTKLQRLDHIKSNPQTMLEVTQRVADGETLKEISKAWEIPFGLFQLWIMTDRERSDMYDGALRARADEEVHNAIKISDDEYCRELDGSIMKDKAGLPVFKETSRSRLQAKTRLSAAVLWDRKRFGTQAGREAPPLKTGNEGVGELVKVLAQAFEKLDLRHKGEIVDAKILKEETI